MNWDDLRIFLAVARAGTLSAAGQRLGIDATTVARRVARLEARLGRTLFELTPAGHVLTPRGVELLTHAEAMESAALALSVSDAEGGHPGGTIRVSVSEGFGGSIIAPHLARFTAANPDLAVELVASTGFLNPSRREADVAIMLARPKAGPLLVRKMTDYRLGLYAARDAAPDGIARIADLARHRLVGYVPDLIYSPELRYLEDVGEGLAASIASTSVAAQATMIASGAGVGIIPCFIGDADPRLARLLPDRIDIRRTFWLVVHRDLRGVSRVSRFVDWLDALVIELRPMIEGSEG
ncbi:MAG: LysR family transcriptional regulator [Sphingomonas sanxanigenens]|uniref:LysR family transcriptional regulator n=1 Tax=Sphingomonas sanxanigenens TaxID=397260 RepID=A0A2W5AF90_9SPHN|nr:MAG: LysR family transcriptional regulator [Sphingomonas sanxanigenens]